MYITWKFVVVSTADIDGNELSRGRLSKKADNNGVQLFTFR